MPEEVETNAAMSDAENDVPQSFDWRPVLAFVGLTALFAAAIAYYFVIELGIAPLLRGVSDVDTGAWCVFSIKAGVD